MTDKSRIPYRNSKLTRILQDALGGSSVGLLICNIAPGVKFRQDTLNTLKWGSLVVIGVLLIDFSSVLQFAQRMLRTSLSSMSEVGSSLA